MDQPNFIICGAQKAGTTSLFHYMNPHPEIYMPAKKELHFFDNYVPEEINQYKQNFNFESDAIKVSGEATPIYMYLESTPKHIYENFPDVKLIFILRNPVDRAYSHYWHVIKMGHEYLSFEKAIEKEEERLNTGDVNSKRYFSYKDRGKYVKQLRRFEEYFPKDQILILLQDDLKKHPNEVLKQVYSFLGVDENFSNYDLSKEHNSGKQPHSLRLQQLSSKMPVKILRDLINKFNLRNGYTPLNYKMRDKLDDYFRPYNQELEQYLNRKLDW